MWMWMWRQIKVKKRRNCRKEKKDMVLCLKKKDVFENTSVLAKPLHDPCWTKTDKHGLCWTNNAKHGLCWDAQGIICPTWLMVDQN